jgi:hypothetical protein
MGAADTMVKSFLGERLKRSILVHILLNKEPSLVAGQSQQLLVGTGILPNPPESPGGFRGKYRKSCPTGIPVKNSCDSKKKNLRPLQNHVPVKNYSGKHRKKKNPQESWQERFFCPKHVFLKTRITNLGGNGRQQQRW